MKKSMDGIVKDASEQADKASESVDNIYNISTQIEYISKEMTDMYDTVNAVSVAEKDASRIMEELNDANQEMLYTIGRIAEQITVTNDSVQAIQQTIDMIRNIADETDLLAVNASIEAAHAGAAGRGFAVIAEQISKLASMSADNAGEVEKTLSSIMDETAKMVQLMEVQTIAFYLFTAHGERRCKLSEQTMHAAYRNLPDTEEAQYVVDGNL